jgi:hypothetical protein
MPNANQRIASNMTNSNKLASGISRLQHEKVEIVEQQSTPAKAIINVFGEEEPDPICNYLNCNHAFSLHRDSNDHCKGAACNCRHPQNSVIGLR